MLSIVTKLRDNLLRKLDLADELWVAVGLINLAGVNFLLDNTGANCTRNFLLGIDLPTDPKALHRLNELQLKPNLNVRLLKDRDFYYHPKMYLVRSNGIFSGFIGSANCTNGGLSNNIELTIQVEDQMICTDLKSWFEERFDRADHLTSSFLETYEAGYSERQRRQSEEEKVAMKLKKRSPASSREEMEEVVKIEMSRFPPLPESSGPSPIEEAWKIKLLLNIGHSRMEVRTMFPRPGGRKGRKVQPASNSFINMTLRCLDFPKAIQDKIHNGSLPISLAYLLHKSSPKKSPGEWLAILEHAEELAAARGEKYPGKEDFTEADAWNRHERLSG